MDFSQRKRSRHAARRDRVPVNRAISTPCLVYYTIRNKDTGKHKVGIRVLLDTFIGANDGVPFTIPGRKGFVKRRAEFARRKSPITSRSSRSRTIPRTPARWPGWDCATSICPMRDLEAVEKLRICRFPGQHAPAGTGTPESMDADRERRRRFLRGPVLALPDHESQRDAARGLHLRPWHAGHQR